MADYEQVYEDFWRDIVENVDGTLNKDAVMRELSDFYNMLEEVPQVYLHVTGWQLSKPNYLASSVISVADEYQERLIQEAITDFLHDYDIVDPR